MLTVGAIVKEPIAVVQRFIDWHLRNGADRVALCFDDPNDPAVDIAASRPEVEVTRCDAAFWDDVGVDPSSRFTLRQNTAIRRLYETAGPGWFLNVDGDELVHLEGRTLAEELAGQPADVIKLGFLPAEPLQTPHDAETLHVRTRQAKPWLIRNLYGDLAPGLMRRGGLLGHNFGKIAFRTGLSLKSIRQHDVQDQNGEAPPGPHLGPAEGAWLLHFVDQGFEAWRSKAEWRLGARGFSHKFGLALQAALDAEDAEAALREIYDRLFVFDQDRIDLLKRGGAHASWSKGSLGL